ncbi:charged multivesicular body protein 7 isoform X2 [Carassius carassius]|uniref:charged multivesicular body protein 7 isoform X2 n=1 Tax=Carassius carassius TaxID=217509 RepID=UPI0028693B8D|nr:charged multivesicular body protein 7 isoform X2 [Carassius carassius]
MSVSVEKSDAWFPPDWEDDERMAFLFSAFKENRDVDCTDWDGKIDFWSPLIIDQCRRRGSVCVNLQELNESFRRKGSVPLGLSTVLQSMIRSGKVQKESDFAANVDSGWLSWGVGLLLVRPLKWTLSALLGSGRVPLEESFVVIDLVKLVKFSQAGQSRVPPVSEVDLGIYQLQRSEKLLEERVETLGQEAEKCKQQAKSLLKEGKKSQALRCLRGSKRVEKKADRLFAQLETVKGILDRIANSQTDRLVMQAYQAGVAALRISLKGVTVERAENLVDQIQELCDTQDEVNQTLASGALDSGEDSEELEEELKSLLEKTIPDNDVLPAVPTHPFSPPRKMGILDADFVQSLPSVPDSSLGITDEELDRELSRLRVSDTAVPRGSISAHRKLEPAQ